MGRGTCYPTLPQFVRIKDERVTASEVITGKPETAPLPSFRYFSIHFSSRLTRAAIRTGARLTAAQRPAVFQNPKTGIR